MLGSLSGMLYSGKGYNKYSNRTSCPVVRVLQQDAVLLEMVQALEPAVQVVRVLQVQRCCTPGNAMIQ